MAFQLPGLPNLNANIPQTDPVEQLARVAQLRNMMSEQALRQALAPSQVQQAQAQAQQAQQSAEIQRIQLQDSQIMSDYFKTGDVGQDVGQSSTDFSMRDKVAAFTGIDKNDPIMGMLAGLAKKGYSGPGLMAAAQGAVQKRTEYNKGTEELQTIQKNDRLYWQEALASLHEMPEDQRSAQLAAKLPALLENSKSDPLLGKYAAALSGHPELIDPVYNAVNGENAALGLRKAKGEAAEAEAKAAKETAAAVAPTPDQQTTALSGVNSYKLIPPNMRASLQNEIRNAPNKEALDKIEARADTINESFQRSADARAQAAAMKDVGTKNLVAGRLLQMDEELGKGLDQTAGIRGLLDLSKGGNETATAAALTRFAEHEIVEGGVKRMNQLEYENLASKLGSYGRQFDAWATKGFQGEMPAATNKEIQTILDAEDAAAHKAHDRSVGYVMDRYGAGEVRGNQPPTPESLTPPSVAGPNMKWQHRTVNGKVEWRQVPTS